MKQSEFNYYNKLVFPFNAFVNPFKKTPREIESRPSPLPSNSPHNMEQTKPPLLLLLLLLLLSTSLSLIPPSSTTTATTTSKGRPWKLLTRNLGISAMHMQLLPNDHLIAFDRTGAGPSNISLPSISSSRTTHYCLNLSTHTDCTSHSVVFNPSTRSIRPLTLTTETWCSSGSLSPNGTLIQTGGFASGDHAVRSFSLFENSDWVENLQGLDVRRWYSTDQILPDGRIIVVGGRAQFNYEFVPKSSDSDHAVFQLPFLQETKDASENNLYPFVHLSTDGNLFVFANTKAILLDYKTNKVVRRFQEMPGGVSRNYPSSGSSVLLPLRLGSTEIKAEVMVCGGAITGSFVAVQNGTFLPASSTCGRLVITDESPVWEMEEMPVGRVMGDMVLLPTGDVLIINGAGKGTAGWGNARDPVLSPVLYTTGALADGSTTSRGGFEVMEPTSFPRLYHSTAHLISDGRVVVGGSNPNIRYEFNGVLFPTELSLEAFSPPYLTNSRNKLRRPRIISIVEADKDEVVYGEKVRIRFVMSGNGSRSVHVTMVAPSFTTHSFSMNQRVLVLERSSGGLSRVRGELYEVEVVGPSSGVLAPAGYYMVFVVHGGVPSRGRWVHVREES